MIERVERPGAEYYSPARRIGELLKAEMKNDPYFYFQMRLLLTSSTSYLRLKNGLGVYRFLTEICQKGQMVALLKCSRRMCYFR